MKVRQAWTDLRDVAHRFGFAAAATDAWCRLLRHLCDGRCHVVVLVTPAALRAPDLPAPTDEAPRFLSDEEVSATAARNPELFDIAFATAARARGDECVACFSEGRVVSTAWYTRHPSQLPNGLWAQADPRYIYSYKGYTLAPFRGKRFAGQRGTFVVRSFGQRGYDGVIAEIAANNFSSLRNAWRLGARRVGVFVTWRMFGRYRSITSPGCRAYGYRVGRAPVGS